MCRCKFSEHSHCQMCFLYTFTFLGGGEGVSDCCNGNLGGSQIAVMATWGVSDCCNGHLGGLKLL